MISLQISQMLELSQGFNVAIRGIVSKVNHQQQMFQCVRISTEKKMKIIKNPSAHTGTEKY